MWKEKANTCWVICLNKRIQKLMKKKIVKSFSKVDKDKDKDKKHALTYDNDTEFSKYESTGAKLAWKYILLIRITVGNVVPNKNTHRLLKQYFPKKTPLGNASQKRIDYAMKEINSRPRKRLDYLAPYKIFYEKNLKF